MDDTSSLTAAMKELSTEVHNLGNILQNLLPRLAAGGGGGGAPSSGGPPAARGGGGGGRPPMSMEQQVGRLKELLATLPSLPGPEAYGDNVLDETFPLTRKKFGPKNLRQVLTMADGVGYLTWAMGKTIEKDGPEWSSWSGQFADSNWKLLWALAKTAYPGGVDMSQGNTTENDDVPF